MNTESGISAEVRAEKFFRKLLLDYVILSSSLEEVDRMTGGNPRRRWRFNHTESQME